MFSIYLRIPQPSQCIDLNIHNLMYYKMLYIIIYPACTQEFSPFQLCVFSERAHRWSKDRSTAELGAGLLAAHRTSPLERWVNIPRSLQTLVLRSGKSTHRAIGKSTITGWWFGTFLFFFHLLGTIIPIDFHIFQRGRYTTNQKNILSLPFSNCNKLPENDIMGYRI